MHEMQILDHNLRYFNYLPIQAMELAGRGIAEEVEEHYGRGKKIAVFCGPGGNGGDGLTAARHLRRHNLVQVFFLRPHELTNQECKQNWRLLRNLNIGKKEIRDSAELAEVKDEYEVIVDALLGVGAEGELKEPFASAVKKMNSMKGKKVAVDIPTPGFKADLVLSLHKAKVKDALVIDVGIPPELGTFAGPGELLALTESKPESHKGENGKLLIIAGSGRYHGALVMATKTAAHFADLVYVASVPENLELVRKMKQETAAFIPIREDEIPQYLGKVDAVLIGPGMEISERTRKLTELVLKAKVKTVMDADALKVASRSHLHPLVLVTPHEAEFTLLFGKKASAANVTAAAKECNCIVLRKGPVDVISDGKRTKFNFTGNAGMTKGGTGDTLAGLAAAFACKNELFLAGCAAAFLNGLSGEYLAREMGYAYSTENLIEQIPRTLLLIQGKER